MQSEIKTDSLAIGYRTRRGTKTVAGGIGATVDGGRLTCLIGPNGAGKSTLLRTLSASQPRLGGSISICGRDIDSIGAKEMARTVAIVLTEKPDAANMTVGELVCLGRSPYTGFWGSFSDSDRRAAAEAMATVGIDGLARRRVATLSDGERQKAMIAKALAQDTPVVMLDEPTAYLDYPSKADMMRLLHRIAHETGKVVFLSTHDLDLALQTADTLWLMGKGGRLSIGSPEDLALDGRLAAFFNHDGLEFDPASGLFNISLPPTRSVGVAGERGTRLAMLAKALRRNGIAAAPPRPSTDCIEVTPTEFLVTKGGKTTAAATIAEAVERLIGSK